MKNGLTTGYADFAMVLGIPGDVPVAGDWNSDGMDSPGVFRPASATFYLSNQIINGSVFAGSVFGYGGWVVGDGAQDSLFEARAVGDLSQAELFDDAGRRLAG
ncbi:MAG: hypothetical protein ABI947_05845, partial [Chloroflexota bacterium]